jgi:hypothetical protein
MLRTLSLVQGLELHHAVVVLFVSWYVGLCKPSFLVKILEIQYSPPFSPTKVINIYIITSS